MTTLYLLLAGFMVIYSMLDAIHDFYMNESRCHCGNEGKSYSRKWHSIDSIIKTLVIIAISSSLIFSPIGDSFTGEGIIHCLRMIFLSLAIRWIIFDLTINFMFFGWKDLLYKGGTSGLDILFPNKYYMLLAKIILLGIIIWSFWWDFESGMALKGIGFGIIIILPLAIMYINKALKDI